MKTKQWNAFLSILLQNMDPEVLDVEVLQRSLVGNPQAAGAEFTRFLQNGCRFNLGGLKIKPVPFNPAQFSGLGQGWSLIAEEHDSRNDTLTEVDFNLVEFITCLNDGESSIKGEEKLARLKADGRLRLGAATWHALWLDHQALRENSVLETLYRLKKISYFDFFGDVLLAPGGRRCVLYLVRRGGRWDWIARWLGDGWGASCGSAVSQVAS